MRLLVLCLALICSITTTSAATRCGTSGTCEVGTTCTCSVPAEPTHDRYFYIQFEGFEKGHIYQCKMSNTVGLTFLVATAKVPDGAGLTCAGSCQRFPVTLVLDTRQLVKASDAMLVKFFVAGTDIQTDLNTRCEATY